MDLSIIIVSYNTKDYVKKCIDSIYESNLPFSFEIIVVDNNSSDKSCEFIKKNFNRVVFIENKENFGFSKANNIGIKKAKGDYILFLNPDMEVNSETIKYMLQFMENQKDCGASTCRVVLQNGKLDDSCHRGFPTPWNAFCHFSSLSKIFPKSKNFSGYNLGFLDMSKTHEVDSIAGSFMLVRRDAGAEINWWDEDYFFYGEDIDFCFELKEKKWKIYYVPEVYALHHKGVASGIKKISQGVTTASLETKKWATNQRFFAMKIFYKKHYQNKYPRIVNALVFVAIDLKLWFSLKTI